MRLVGLGTPVRGVEAGGVISWQGSVKDKDLTAPPGSPSTGDRYIVASGATGAWAGQEDNIAEWTGSAWTFDTPEGGWAVWIDDESEIYVFNGSSWNQESLGPHAATHTSGADKLPSMYSGDVLRRDAADWQATQINAAVIDYLVGPVEQARFQTVQAAITQAVADGYTDGNPVTIYILDGTYTEDLTLSPGIHLASVASGPQCTDVDMDRSVVITGNHALSAAGSVKFWDIQLDGGSGSSTFSLPGATANRQLYFYSCKITSASGQSLLTFGTGLPEFAYFYDSALKPDGAAAFAGGTLPIIQADNCLVSRLGGSGDVIDLSAGTLIIRGNRSSSSGVSGRVHIVSGAPTLILDGLLMTASVEQVQVDSALNPQSYFANCIESGTGEAIEIAGAQASSFRELPDSAVKGDIWEYDGNQFVLVNRGVENKVQTTDATVTTIATIPIPDDTAVIIEAKVVAFRTNGADQAAYKKAALVFRRSAGIATLQGTVEDVMTDIESDAAWVATIDVDGASNARIRVTGAGTKDVEWKSFHTVKQVS